MNKEQYQGLLLTRVLQGNGFGNVKKLVAAIQAACEIPEDTRWRDRKDAFNAIGDLAPLRGRGVFALTHADIPAFLETEWVEYNSLKCMIKSSSGSKIDEVLSQFWLTDAEMADDHRDIIDDAIGEAGAPAPGA